MKYSKMTRQIIKNLDELDIDDLKELRDTYISSCTWVRSLGKKFHLSDQMEHACNTVDVGLGLLWDAVEDAIQAKHKACDDCECEGDE